MCHQQPLTHILPFPALLLSSLLLAFSPSPGGFNEYLNGLSVDIYALPRKCDKEGPYVSPLVNFARKQLEGSSAVSWYSQHGLYGQPFPMPPNAYAWLALEFDGPRAIEEGELAASLAGRVTTFVVGGYGNGQGNDAPPPRWVERVLSLPADLAVATDSIFKWSGRCMLKTNSICPNFDKLKYPQDVAVLKGGGYVRRRKGRMLLNQFNASLYMWWEGRREMMREKWSGSHAKWPDFR